MRNLNARLEHLRPLFDKGDLVLLPVSFSRQIEMHLQTLPWVGQTIDFSQFGSMKKIVGPSLEIVSEELKETKFGMHEYALAFFNGEDPVVCGTLKTIIHNIDAIFWKAPGPRFVFGADKEADSWMPIFDHFIQYTGGDSLLVSA